MKNGFMIDNNWVCVRRVKEKKKMVGQVHVRKDLKVM